MYNFAHKIGTNISSLSVDTSTNTAKHSNRRATKTVSRNAVHHEVPVISFKLQTVAEKSEVKNNDAKTSESETHHGTSAESSVEAVLVSLLLGIDGGTNVGEHGDLHADVSRGNGSDSAEDEGESGEKSLSHILTPGDKSKDQEGKEKHEDSTDAILGAEECLGTS